MTKSKAQHYYLWIILWTGINRVMSYVKKKKKENVAFMVKICDVEADSASFAKYVYARKEFDSGSSRLPMFLHATAFRKINVLCGHSAQAKQRHQCRTNIINYHCVVKKKKQAGEQMDIHIETTNGLEQIMSLYSFYEL